MSTTYVKDGVAFGSSLLYCLLAASIDVPAVGLASRFTVAYYPDSKKA